MLTDIEIAAQAKMKRITDVAAAMGIRPEELEPYGHYKAKLSDDLLTRLQDRPDGKLVLGEWQSIFFIELDGPRPKRGIELQLLGND